ncbi:MAG: hypothetical protein GXO20_04010 [Thermodesulfobacteria bacterium]|nr:hypothetical protein [Thermodesulfobacteriota bacterium]
MRLAGDRTVGRLVKWLRILGIPCELITVKSKEEIPEDVFLLTRATSLASARSLVLPCEKPAAQLRFVLEKLPHLWEEMRPFSLCLPCNERLEEISKEEVFGLVPDHVYETQRRFRRCPRCGRIYWPGSHHSLMKRRLEEILGRPLTADPDGSEGRS